MANVAWDNLKRLFIKDDVAPAPDPEQTRSIPQGASAHHFRTFVNNGTTPEMWQEVADFFSGYGRTNTALKFSALYACNDRLSKDVASLPFRPMRITDAGQEKATDYDQYFLSKQPSRLRRKYPYFYTLNSHTNLLGNAFSPITRNNAGRPIAYDIWDPKDVTYKIFDGFIMWINKRLKDADGKPLVISDDDMIHLMWYTYDGIIGQSVLSFAADSIGLGLSATKMTKENYTNAIYSPYYLSYAKTLTKEAKDIIVASLQSMQGEGQGDINVIDEGSKFEPYPISGKDKETLESREISARDICRFMGVPGSKVNLRDGNSSYNSLEQENTAYVQDSILPRCIQIEEEFDVKSVADTDEDRIRFKFELKSRLRGDMNARSTYYSNGVKDGWLSINQIARLEDMDTIGPEGDERYINGANVPLSKLYSGDLEAYKGMKPADKTEKEKLFESLQKNGNGHADQILHNQS